MQRSQTEEYLANKWNIDKMLAKKFTLSKQYGANFQTLQLSFFTRHATMDFSSFGDPTEEEPNLAYSILLSSKKVRPQSETFIAFG